VKRTSCGPCRTAPRKSMSFQRPVICSRCSGYRAPCTVMRAAARDHLARVGRGAIAGAHRHTAQTKGGDAEVASSQCACLHRQLRRQFRNRAGLVSVRIKTKTVWPVRRASLY
jgi:hypothetical protein